MDSSLDKPEPPQPRPHIIHIIVEVDGKDKPISFDRSPVSGGDIRSKAGAPATDDLTRLVHGKPSGGNIGINDPVEIKNGDRFLALPTGTVS